MVVYHSNKGSFDPYYYWMGGEDRQLSVVHLNRLNPTKICGTVRTPLPLPALPACSINAGFNDIDIPVVTMTLRLQLLASFYRVCSKE